MAPRPRRARDGQACLGRRLGIPGRGQGSEGFRIERCIARIERRGAWSWSPVGSGACSDVVRRNCRARRTVKNNLGTLMRCCPAVGRHPRVERRADAGRDLGCRCGGVPDEVLVVDGGSTDDTAAVAGRLGARVLVGATRPGRAACSRRARRQGRPGCCCCTPTPSLARAGRRWWRRISAGSRIAPAISASRWTVTIRGHGGWNGLVAWRCRALALPYGDQGLLIASRPAARGGRHATVAVDGRCGSGGTAGPAPARGVDGGCDHLGGRNGSVTGGIGGRLRNLACLSLYFAGVPPRLIAWLY